MADERTEKQKVQEITDKLEEGLKELLSTVEGYEDFVQALMNVALVPIGFEDIPGDSKGYFHTSDYSFGYIAGWSSGKDMKEQKSSLYTIRKTASELITGIEGALQELQLNRVIEQEQSKECILLIQNEDLTEFSLVNVSGMDTQELVAALSTMTEDDKLSMQAELSGNEINKEAQLLYGNSDKYGIYQLKSNPELAHLRFEGTESLKRMGITKGNFDAIKPENYELIYVGELSELQEQTQGETLEAIYEKFNIDHPEDYTGHSLSVSDIVVLHQNGENSAHFVDFFGFTRLLDFMKKLEGVKSRKQRLTPLDRISRNQNQRNRSQRLRTTRWKMGMKSLTLAMERNRCLQI